VKNVAPAPAPVVQQPAPKQISAQPDYTIKRLPTKLACTGNSCVAAIPWEPVFELLKWVGTLDRDKNGFQVAWTLDNNLDISWDLAAKTCDKQEVVNSGDFFLIWRDGVKTCGILRPKL
jgi:hypothetical protein